MGPEQALVERVIAGDPAGEEEFFKAYRPRLLRASQYFLGGQDSEAEDVVQDTFMVALPKLKDYIFNAPIYAWLRQICLRLCYARLRTRNRVLVSVEEDLETMLQRQAVERVRSDDAELHKQAKLVVLRELIQRLGPDSREIIELRSLKGMSYEMIHQALGIPLGTVMSRLSRARDQLRQLLSEVPEACPEKDPFR
jgi:RNA polymerase sigma-70 factor (ECF subfamily)